MAAMAAIASETAIYLPTAHEAQMPIHITEAVRQTLYAATEVVLGFGAGFVAGVQLDAQMTNSWIPTLPVIHSTLMVGTALLSGPVSDTLQRRLDDEIRIRRDPNPMLEQDASIEVFAFHSVSILRGALLGVTAGMIARRYLGI